MRVILIASQKGGSGKSTLAAHFGVLADATGKAGRAALLIDADPQGSLAYWHDLREADTPLLARSGGGDENAILADAKASGLKAVLLRVKSGDQTQFVALSFART